jgi:hypothetical protein
VSTSYDSDKFREHGFRVISREQSRVDSLHLHTPITRILLWNRFTATVNNDAPSHVPTTVRPTAGDSGCILTKHTSVPSSPFRAASWTKKQPQVSFEAAPRLILDRRMLSSGISQLPQDVLGHPISRIFLPGRSDNKATWRHGSFASLGEMRRNPVTQGTQRLFAGFGKMRLSAVTLFTGEAFLGWGSGVRLAFSLAGS